MRGVPWRLLGAGVATAILLDLAFPIAGPMHVEQPVFAWIALVPLLVGLLRLPVTVAGARRRWILGWSLATGWLTGAVWFGANCYWVYDTMHLYGGMSGPMAVVALIAFSLYLGFWLGAFALALAVVRLGTVNGRFAWIGVAAIPFLWVTMEFLLDRVPMFPWDLLGYSQVDNGLLMRLAPWTGVYGISFALAGANVLIVAGELAWGKHATRRWVDAATYRPFVQVVILIAFVFSAGVLSAPPKPGAEATAVLVQPNLNVASDDVWVGPEWDRHIASYTELGSQSCGTYLAGMPDTGAAKVMPKCRMPMAAPSLIAMPESPAPFRDADGRFQTAMRSMATTDKAPMIVGAVGMNDNPAGQTFNFYNSAVVVAPDGHFVGRYDKIHLVPFGEYVPFRKVLFFIQQVAASMSDMSTGSERKVFTLNGHRYGIFICYESVFGDEVRQFAINGAEVFVNISDDGWYGDTSAPWQHLNMARMRAAENRRWILRDTNNGVTGSIDPYGTVRQSIPRHAVDALAAQYGFNSELTFYTVHGDWLAELCAILSLVLVLGSARRILGEISSKPAAQTA
jgi:apolipoprotein N-acyltransferase